MHRIPRFAVLVLVAALALAVGGCKDQTEEANAAVDRANGHIARYNEADEVLAGLLDQIDEVEPTVEGAQRGLELLGKVEAEQEKQARAVDGARAEFERIRAMDVPEEFKGYAAKELDVIEGLEDIDEAAADLVESLSALYAALAEKKASDADVATLSSRIETESARMGELEDDLADLKSAAERYYIEKVAN